MNQKQEKAYIKPLTTFVVISEKECIMNIWVSPKTQLQVYTLKHTIS